MSDDGKPVQAGPQGPTGHHLEPAAAAGIPPSDRDGRGDLWCFCGVRWSVGDGEYWADDAAAPDNPAHGTPAAFGGAIPCQPTTSYDPATVRDENGRPRIGPQAVAWATAEVLRERRARGLR